MLAYDGSLEIFEKHLKTNGQLLISPKLDGIRAIVTDKGLVSRSLKPIRNIAIQQQFNNSKYIGLDGELIVGDPTDKLVFNRTTSIVMSINKVEAAKYYIFDNYLHDSKSYMDRLNSIKNVVDNIDDIVVVPIHIIEKIDHLLSLEEKYLDEGYEGLIIRTNRFSYKYGRATAKEGSLGKFKRFVDSEAIIMGIECLYHNDNEAFKDELGNTSRSSSQNNLVAMETMGALHIRDIYTGIECKLGTGFAAEERKWFWENRYQLDELIIKYSYFPVGMKDLPRHPSYKGIRDKDDMSK